MQTIFENTRTSQIANFISIPTDCPQRDERLGWMADAQVFAHTAIYNGDVAGFFNKWLRDVRLSQSAEGGYSDVSPRLMDANQDGAPAWGDAGVIVTYHMYRMYGDLQIIEDNYDNMCKWLEYIRSANQDLIWVNKVHADYGEWLSVNESTPKTVVSTAYFAYDALLLSFMAKAVGKKEDVQKYGKLHSDISNAFIKKFVNSTNGKIEGDTQSSYLFALSFKLLPLELLPMAVQNLVDNIKRRNYHLTTGFLGK